MARSCQIQGTLGTSSEEEVGILTSFGIAVGQCVLMAAPPIVPLPKTALSIRDAILAQSAVVGLGELLSFCWAVGIPVIQMRLFPLPQKRMHAMTVEVADRNVILLGRESRYAAQAAYIIAHEIGHIFQDHADDIAAVLDVEDPLEVAEPDPEEQAADRFALELLTGDPAPRIEANIEQFSATQLADAAMAAALDFRVDAGVLALCLAHATGKWKEGFGSLKIIPPQELDVGTELNTLARQELDWARLSLENRDYVLSVMGELVAD